MAVTTRERRQQERPPIWRNVTFLKWAAQIVITGLILFVLGLIYRTGIKNLEESDVSFGWDWLTTNLQFAIREGIDTNPDSGVRTIVAGIINTLRVSASGIIAATVIGTLIGVARLSKNWIVNKLATVYIETIRNVPLLVQIFFWQALIIDRADLLEGDVGGVLFKVSNKGVAVPWLFPSIGFYQWMIFVAIGAVVAGIVYYRRKRIFEETGRETYAFSYSVGAFALIALIGWFAHPIMGFFGPIFRGIATFIDAWPAFIIPLLIAILAIGSGLWWIRNFFESRRTPAGFGKLTDDDWFRVVFAAVSGLVVAFIAFRLAGFEFDLPPGSEVERASLAELGRTGLANVFDWFGDKFHFEAGAPLDFQTPEVVQSGRFVQFGTTGMVISPPFLALWTGVTLYTAAFIAEIVRGGILAVSKGQTEASQALGFRRGQYLRLIILPQAFRIILPPMGNQYLNLFKNTSLGLAVAFPDIVSVGSTIFNQTGQSLPVVLTWQAFFLGGSLAISALVNYYNRRMQLVER